METLTLFIEDIYSQELGQESFQVYDQKTINNRNYKDITISGSRIANCIFENVIFENCTFWSSKIDNSLFINCLFINCKFQFTDFTCCNFEASSFDNCIWGLSKLQGAENANSFELSKNISYESILPTESTRSLNLIDYFSDNLMTA